MTTRRQFLATAFGSLGAAAVGGSLSSLALASITNSDRYFVFCYFPGAWDVLMSMDPKPGLVEFNDVRDSRIEVDWESPETDRITTATNGLAALPALIDPVSGEPRIVTNVFQPFVADGLLDRTTFVRGMSMDTLTHEVGRRRFLTGRPPSGLDARGNSISTVMASLLGVAEPIPNLSGAVESYNADMPSYASALNVSAVDDLLRALRPGQLNAAPEERERVESMLQSFRECLLVKRSPMRKGALNSRDGANALVTGGFDRAFDLTANNAEMNEIRERFNFTGTATNTVQARMAMAAQAITNGVSRVVTVQASRSCDTHFDNWSSDQFDIQAEGMQGIAALAGHLASRIDTDGVSFLDKTTILAFSDFSRTPLFNGNGGRDHWLMGGCFLISPDLRPGVWGQSSNEGMSPTRVDLNTGGPGNDLVKPEHILATLFKTVGDYDQDSMPNDLRVDGYHALLNG